MIITDLQHSILEARSRGDTDLLYAARDSVLAFLSAPLPSISATYTCAVMNCEAPVRVVYRDHVGKAIGFYGACAEHLRILD